MQTKSIFKSWTFYFGAAQVLLGLIGWLSGLMAQPEAFTLIVTGAGTIGLRIKTTEGVTVIPPTTE